MTSAALANDAFYFLIRLASGLSLCSLRSLAEYSFLKLATDIYDSDDALNRSPLLQPTKVDYRPAISPPPCLPPEASAPSPEHVSNSLSKSSRRRSNRHRKTRSSQGDAVLIGYLGPNYPDIASEAGRRPLNSASQSEASDSDQEMEEREDVPATVTSVQAADAALRLLDGDEASADVHVRPTNGKGGKVQLPTSFNRDDSQTARRHGQNGTNGNAINIPLSDDSAMIIDAKDSDAAVHGLLRLKESSPKSAPPLSRMRSASNGLCSDSSLATSPNLRQFAIPASEGSPMETLPAMQISPPHSNSAKTPNGERNLPSLVSQFGPLVDAPVIDYDVRTNGIPNHSRQSFSSASGGPGRSPPMSSASVAGQDRRLQGQYITSQQRQAGHYQAQHPTTQTSPASAYSETSPRETYRQGQDPAGMSPPGKPGYHPYYPNRRASQNDEHGPPYGPPATGEVQYTPTSADGNPSSESYTPSTDANLNEHRMSIDGGGPPSDLPASQQNGPLMSGGFKCDYSGCPAPPFQTQYLLNSHANVHSQNRPHYCPMKGCPRGEGGKGFKRKNEMIRHGLVHDSPGYVCPFCPDREHKYPRPDNLQRHVRVHHVDKDKDDAQLREVLAQRPEGGNRGRRRRLGG
ncbi:MAG: hypothetical protein M1830_005378 [Pleopsidium flavum]|nr:MAG: hypothetical protein M1830_005378 [Pleopsidium flavum]